MENRIDGNPVINISGISPAPGADEEAWIRYKKWVTEVYIPLFQMKRPFVMGCDRYQIVSENPEYPTFISVIHHPDLKTTQENLNDPSASAVREEVATWVKRRVIDYVYSRTIYELIKSFRSDASTAQGKTTTMIDNAPFIHLEGYRLLPEDQERFKQWLDDYGFNIFMPLLVTLPGLKGYDCYRGQGLNIPATVREFEYPYYVSIIYFEDKDAFDKYRKGPEDVAFQKAIRNVFPSGLNLKWYVQYTLVKSWRK